MSKIDVSKLKASLKRLGIVETKQPLDFLFDKQLAFVNNTSKRKAAHPGRRGGKTYMVAAYAIKVALQQARCHIPYITITRKQAKEIIWPYLHILKEECGLEAEFNEASLQMKFTNGSMIALYGCDKKKEAEKLRGPAYPIVFIDEIGSLGEFMSYLVKDVLKAALFDHDGTIVCTGTPPAAGVGYFFNICNHQDKAKWSVSHWTVLDNPMLPVWKGKKDWKSVAQRKMKEWRDEEGWTEDNPTYQREMLGQWIKDTNSMVYKYVEGRNDYVEDSIDLDGYKYVIGVDLGFDDPCAWVVWAFEEKQHPVLHQVFEYGKTGLYSEEIADITRKMIDVFNPIKVVVDSGGLGKTIVEEMKVRHALPVEAADKNKKADYIELMNSDFHEGRIKALKDSQLVKEWQYHQWEYDIEASKDRRRKEAATDNHYADAALYSWRWAYHWTHEPDTRPKPGTPERIELDAEQMFFNRNKSKDWYEDVL